MTKLLRLWVDLEIKNLKKLIREGQAAIDKLPDPNSSYAASMAKMVETYKKILPIWEEMIDD